MKEAIIKKLIEVALPLEAINKESVRRKRKAPAGYPTALHKWWAQRPVAAARAVIFAQMVDDPSSNPELFPTRKKQEEERRRLFQIIEELVLWENTKNVDVLTRAHNEILASWKRDCVRNKNHPNAKELFNPDILPTFHDPFAGGGSLPMEAQRLGLSSIASDLNPVAVLINKAMVEIPHRFANSCPVGPPNEEQSVLSGRTWAGTEGIAEDIRRYGEVVRSEAKRKLAKLFPEYEITSEIARGRPELKKYIGRKLTVVAWIWTRTVKSPNPAFSKVEVPLASTFMLSDKTGKEVYVEPIKESGQYRFTIKHGKPKNKTTKTGTKLSRANFQCLMSGSAISGDYIKSEGKAGRLKTRMMAVVLKGDRGRVYIAPTKELEDLAKKARPEWKPDIPISGSTQYVGVKPYGMENFSDLFSDRQALVLTTFSEVIQGLLSRIKVDSIAAGFKDDNVGLADGGIGAQAYAESVTTYLVFVLSRVVHYSSMLCAWLLKDAAVARTFTKQAFQMSWDFAEGNVFGSSSTEWGQCCDVVSKTIEMLPSSVPGQALMEDAGSATKSSGLLISTDPPYYDNVPYADLSDYFYGWLRHSLKPIFPNLFATLAVPKVEELVAFAHRHNGKAGAESFFLNGMTKVMSRLVKEAHPVFPVTIYYAFKQSEQDDDDGIASTGWDTFLASVISAGFRITGTWPMRTEGDNRQRGVGANALASSIVLVCRHRLSNAQTSTRRDFIKELKSELPSSLTYLQDSGILPVDLAQAAIGPGMAIFSKYSNVLDADDSPMTVRAALVLINEILDEILNDNDGKLDSHSRWAMAWFEQHGMQSGTFDEANKFAQAKNVGMDVISAEGFVHSKSGKVALIPREKFEDDWFPENGETVSQWFAMQQLIRRLQEHGEREAGLLLRKLGAVGMACRDLAYRCYSVCEKSQWAQEALAYNSLVTSWGEIVKQSRDESNLTQGNFKIK